MEKLGGYLRRCIVQEGEGRDLIAAIRENGGVLGLRDLRVDEKSGELSYFHDFATRVRIIPRQKSYMIIVRGTYSGSAEALCDLRNVKELTTLAEVPKSAPKGPKRGGKARLYHGR